MTGRENPPCIDQQARAKRSEIVNSRVNRHDPTVHRWASHQPEPFHVNVTSKFASLAAFATNQFIVPVTLIPNVTAISSGPTSRTRANTACAASTAGPMASRSFPTISSGPTGRKPESGCH